MRYYTLAAVPFNNRMHRNISYQEPRCTKNLYIKPTHDKIALVSPDSRTNGQRDYRTIQILLDFCAKHNIPNLVMDYTVLGQQVGIANTFREEPDFHRYNNIKTLILGGQMGYLEDSKERLKYFAGLVEEEGLWKTRLGVEFRLHLRRAEKGGEVELAIMGYDDENRRTFLEL